MIKLTTINVLGSANVILNLKKGYDKTLKTILTVSEDLLKQHMTCTLINTSKY